MSAEPTEARGASRGRWLRAILVALGAVIGGLLLIAGLIALLFTIKNAKAKREAQPVFAEMEAAFSRLRLPNGYAVIRSERQGGYYDLLGYQSPGEYRVYAVPRDSRAVDELIGAVEAGGFSVPQEDQCSFIADHGP